MMKRVMIADYVHPLLISGLQELGYFVHYIPEAERTHVREWLTGCTGIVVNTKTVVDPELMDASADLRWIGRLGSGLDTIDLAEASRRNIRVLSTPQANANAVAEHALGMLLTLLRNIATADREVRQGIWRREKNRGTEIQGKTIGIIGFGNNGSAFAAKFAGWQVQVLAYDKYLTGYAGHLPFVRETTLQEVLAGADIISLHVPLTAETRHMVNGDFLAQCKPGCILINTSRGKVVDTAALCEALEAGTVHGACVDVLENENLAAYSETEQDLWRRISAMDNVIFTPHIAGWTHESKWRIARQLVDQVGSLEGL